MGYIIKDDIIVKEPRVVSLSGSPNFVEFSGKMVKIYKRRSVLNFSSYPTDPDKAQLSLTMVVEGSDSVFYAELNGTLIKNEAGIGVYFYDWSSMGNTANNIKNAFLLYDEVKRAIDITVLPIFENNAVSGYTIYLRQKGNFGFSFYEGGNQEVIGIANELVEIPTGDCLRIGTNEPDITLDVFSNLAARPGESILPETPEKVGQYLTTLRKTYTSSPLWFNLNSLFSQYRTYNLPLLSGWFNTGTCRTYRFSASAPGIYDYPYYWSDILYVLNGCGRVSETDNMGDYVYFGERVKLLSNKPRTPYVRGQKEFLNFILGTLSKDAPQKMCVSYRAYTTGGRLLGEIRANEINVAELYTVNTCVLDIDNVLDEYPNAGIIYISLMAGEKNVSDDIEYEVLPECLHSLRQFSFLNRFGGWDSVNLDAGIKEDIKPTVDTYDKTLTPSFKKGDSLETVYSVSLSQLFTVEAAPVTNDVADWLKEFAASQVILDGEGNYIIIEDFSLSVSDENFNMQKPILKYRLSETYGK